MACFHVIYMFVFCRSVRPVEINLYDITMGVDIARDIHFDITVSNDIAVCTYQLVSRLPLNLGTRVRITLCSC